MCLCGLCPDGEGPAAQRKARGGYSRGKPGRGAAMKLHNVSPARGRTAAAGGYGAVIFDMDGVVRDTAGLQAALFESCPDGFVQGDMPGHGRVEGEAPASHSFRNDPHQAVPSDALPREEPLGGAVEGRA